MRVLAVFALGAAFFGCQSHPPRPEVTQVPSEVSAGPGVRAFLGDLHEGDSLGDFRVSFVGAVTSGHVSVHGTDAQGRTIEILVTKNGAGALPPVTTKKYAIYFGSLHADGGSPPMPSVTAAVEALADRIRKVEDTAPEPPGLAPYGPAKTGTDI